MAIDIQALMEDIRRRMEGALSVLQQDFAGLRTGRAAVGLLEPIMVDAYDGKMPLNQVGTIGVPDPRTLSVQVWDKSLVQKVERAILESGLGLNPVTDGQTLRVPIPPLTEERRTEITKIAGKYAEDSRIAVRNVRRHAMDDLKRAEKDHEISKDEHHTFAADIQGLTDEYGKKIDGVLEIKEKEIMQV
jgi:ribosome recycling factor